MKILPADRRENLHRRLTQATFRLSGGRVPGQRRPQEVQIADLDDYRSKRDPHRTPEPFGDGNSTNGLRFVIHQHDASRLHYDFRLEADGVLKSWAVPKGPSTDPSQRRLAVPTEDHPLDYLDFEDVIPEGEYGAGTVLVWDTGQYENRTTDEEDREIPVEEAVRRGHVVVWLHGQKLSGGYALTRTGDDSRWLLVKMDDAEADARRRPTSTQVESVKSGRSLGDITREAR